MPRSTRAADSRRLQYAVIATLAVHGLAMGVARCGGGVRLSRGSPALVEIELAPPPPLAERLPDELAGRIAMTQRAPIEPDDDEDVDDDGTVYDAPTAAIDAARRRRHDAGGASDDAAPEGETQVAIALDAAGAAVAEGLPGTGAGRGDGGLDAAPAIAAGSGSAAGDTGAAPVAISAGTAANLLGYFPDGHVVTALVRFDRIRGTGWQAPIDALFHPMPDHQVLIGDRDLSLADLFDTLVISSPHPTNPLQTTLVVKHAVPRPELREVLDEPETPVTWSVATGGMYGARRPGARVMKGDKRQFLGPYAGWIVLAQPKDLPGLTAAGTGDLDTAVAKVALPPWLDGIRAIEAESGTTTGPALVVTMSAGGERIELPDLGLDLPSLPGPERMTVALEIATSGFLIRGNLRFASEADAEELVASVTKARARVLGSTLLRTLLKRSKALDAVSGLTFDRRGARVSYATSISNRDAKGLLAVAAQYLEAYFEAAREEK